MRGPIPLDVFEVDLRVPPRVCGVFCLGKSREQATYVGRADSDLATDIKTYEDRYRFFWFEPTVTATERYRAHCRWYHQLAAGGRAEAIEHPKPPDGVAATCAICGR